VSLKVHAKTALKTDWDRKYSTNTIIEMKATLE